MCSELGVKYLCVFAGFSPVEGVVGERCDITVRIFTISVQVMSRKIILMTYSIMKFPKHTAGKVQIIPHVNIAHGEPRKNTGYSKKPLKSDDFNGFICCIFKNAML